MKILGIDEAGRGPVCGCMVMCGYLIEEENIASLRELKVRDSKMLTAEKRTELAPKLKKLAEDYLVLKIPAVEIDKLRDVSNLNALEISRMQHMINMLKPDKVIIDSPEVNTKNFSRKVMAKVKNKSINIVCENFADKNFPEVSAASIIAKVERDKDISRLHKQHGNFGSGYSHDEITIAFLRAWIKKNKEFPPFVRKSWFTAQRMLEEKQQASVGKFLAK